MTTSAADPTSAAENPTDPDRKARTHLTPVQIAAGDPFLKLLVKLPGSPLTLGLFYSLTFLTFRLFIGWADDCLLTNGDTLGFLNDPALYTNIFFAAGVAAFVMWLPDGLAAVFNGLHDNKVIALPAGEDGQIPDAPAVDAAYLAFLDRARAMFAKRWWTASALVIGVGGPVIFVLPGYLRHNAAQDWCPMIDGLAVSLSLLWIMIPFIGLVVALWYCVIGIYWLNRLFREFTIHVRPLHPDRAGGLSPLGTFSMRLSYTITLIGFILVFTSITRNYVATRTFGFAPEIELLASLIAYLILAPVVFFAPLATAHRSMHEAKHALLLEIDDHFAAEYNRISETLAEADDLEKSLAQFKNLQELHDMVNHFPVWPFNANNLRRFGTSWFSPIILGLLIEALARALG